MTTKILLEETTFGMPSGNYDGSSQDWSADAQQGPGYYQGYSGLQTIHIQVTGFEGSLHIQGTLDSDPDVADWVEVYEFASGGTPLTQIQDVEALGQFAWMRVHVTDFSAGIIDLVTTQYQTGTLVITGSGTTNIPGTGDVLPSANCVYTIGAVNARYNSIYLCSGGVDSLGNITGGNISTSGNITATGNVTVSGNLTVGGTLVNSVHFLEAYANATYTLPGAFTEDPCRYSVVSANVNVPSSEFDTSTYTFTPQTAGYWEITAAYDVFRNSEASMAIKKNNSTVALAGSISAVTQQITKIIYLNGSTDYINIVNLGGNSESRSQSQSKSWFQARWAGE